jgi:hypothetical protein
MVTAHQLVSDYLGKMLLPRIPAPRAALLLPQSQPQAVEELSAARTAIDVRPGRPGGPMFTTLSPPSRDAYDSAGSPLSP